MCKRGEQQDCKRQLIVYLHGVILLYQCSLSWLYSTGLYCIASFIATSVYLHESNRSGVQTFCRVPPGSPCCRDSRGSSCLSTLLCVSLPSAWLFLLPSVFFHRRRRYAHPDAHLGNVISVVIYGISFIVLSEVQEYFSSFSVFSSFCVPKSNI